MSNINKFSAYVSKHYYAHKNATNPTWVRMLRSFKRIYSPTSVDHLIYFAKADAPISDINCLVAYMLSKDVIAIEGGVSMGKALNLTERNEKYVHGILSLSISRLLPKLKSITSLMKSNNVKLNLDAFMRDLHSWDSQNQSSNHNWVKRQWAVDFAYIINRGDSDVSE